MPVPLEAHAAPCVPVKEHVLAREHPLPVVLPAHLPAHAVGLVDDVPIVIVGVRGGKPRGQPFLQEVSVPVEAPEGLRAVPVALVYFVLPLVIACLGVGAVRINGPCRHALPAVLVPCHLARRKVREGVAVFRRVVEHRILAAVSGRLFHHPAAQVVLV